MKDQGAIDPALIPNGSGSPKIERWNSDEVRQTAGENEVSTSGIVHWSCSPIRLRLSLAAW